MLISGVALLFAFAALFYFQGYTLRQRSAHELAVVGEITAHNCATAVMFKDEGAAAQILNGLKTMPQIVSARLEVTDQQRLAYFGGLPDELEIKAARLKSGFQFDGNRIFLAQPVMLDGKPEGTLRLVAERGERPTGGNPKSARLAELTGHGRPAARATVAATGHEPPGRNVEAEIAQDLGGMAVAAERQPDLIETDYRFHRSNHDCRVTNPVSIMP